MRREFGDFRSVLFVESLMPFGRCQVRHLWGSNLEVPRLGAVIGPASDFAWGTSKIARSIDVLMADSPPDRRFAVRLLAHVTRQSPRTRAETQTPAHFNRRSDEIRCCDSAAWPPPPDSTSDTPGRMVPPTTRPSVALQRGPSRRLFQERPPPLPPPASLRVQLAPFDPATRRKRGFSAWNRFSPVDR